MSGLWRSVYIPLHMGFSPICRMDFFSQPLVYPKTILMSAEAEISNSTCRLLMDKRIKLQILQQRAVESLPIGKCIKHAAVLFAQKGSNRLDRGKESVTTHNKIMQPTSRLASQYWLHLRFWIWCICDFRVWVYTWKQWYRWVNRASEKGTYPTLTKCFWLYRTH